MVMNQSQIMFVAEYTLLNDEKSIAYFDSQSKALEWVKDANKFGLLDTFIIDQRSVKMEEFI
jgi:hypothetical protein